jgi:prepilin-type N-terminal cleavage/methylation domain-containing protein/prepilin-type processing-associated H-X9-DG protein
MMMQKRTKKHAGFTLIELLVVIAVIAVLMAILMPSLRAAKQQAAASNCLANARTLAMAWFMYAGDWNDKLVPALMIDNGDKGWIGTPRTEAGALVSISQTSPEVTDEDEIRGIEKGQLFKYVEDAGVYHCPADNIRLSVHDKSRLFATYQIPSCLNGETTANVPQIKTLSNVKRPSTKYNFVESAEARNYNMHGRFRMGAPEVTGSNQWTWWSPMAVNHNKGSILGFCDGHAEKHKWSNMYTIERVDKLFQMGVTQYGQDPAPAGEQEDIRYMAQGWPYQKP